MLWAFAVAGGIGLLLGLWFRVPALIGASGLTAALCLSAAPFTDVGPLLALVITFAMLAMLQAGYLAGLLLSCARSRATAGLPVLARSSNKSR